MSKNNKSITNLFLSKPYFKQELIQRLNAVIKNCILAREACDKALKILEIEGSASLHSKGLVAGLLPSNRFETTKQGKKAIPFKKSEIQKLREFVLKVRIEAAFALESPSLDTEKIKYLFDDFRTFTPNDDNPLTGGGCSFDYVLNEFSINLKFAYVCYNNMDGNKITWYIKTN